MIRSHSAMDVALRMSLRFVAALVALEIHALTLHELTIPCGECAGCPVLSTHRIVSTLNERQEKHEVDETKYGVKDPSKASRPTFSTQTFSVILSIGLCCPPDMCEDNAQ